MYRSALMDKTHPPLILNDTLENFVHGLNIPASITEAITNKYIAVSAPEAKRRGIEPEQYLSYTAEEIARFGKIPEAIVQKILQENKDIVTQLQPNSLRRMHFLSQEEFVIVDQSFKQPVFNDKGKVVAILSYGKDIASYCNLIFLFELYEHYFRIDKAIQQFLRFLKIDQFFYKPPTRRELLTLLAMQINPTAKSVGLILKITPRTVEEYKTRLRIKIYNTELDELIIRLIKRNEYGSLKEGAYEPILFF